MYCAVTVQDVLCVDCKTSCHIILKPSKWRHTHVLYKVQLQVLSYRLHADIHIREPIKFKWRKTKKHVYGSLFMVQQMAHIYFGVHTHAHTHTHADREIARCCALFFKQSPWLCIKCACLFVCLFFLRKWLELVRKPEKRRSFLCCLFSVFLYFWFISAYFPLWKRPYKTSSIPLNLMSFVTIYNYIVFQFITVHCM